MTADGARPESWRELWASCTPVMRVRLAVLLGTMALIAAAALGACAMVAWIAFAGLRGP